MIDNLDADRSQLVARHKAIPGEIQAAGTGALIKWLIKCCVHLSISVPISLPSSLLRSGVLRSCYSLKICCYSQFVEILELSWANEGIGTSADQQVAFRARAFARRIGGSWRRYKSNPSGCDRPKIKPEIFRSAPRRLRLSIIGSPGACLILRPRENTPLRPWDCENDNWSAGFTRDAVRLSGPATYQEVSP